MSIVQNKKAFHDYFVEERFEAGIALEGWEVKAIRAGRAQIGDAYVIADKGALWLLGAHISPLLAASTHVKADPARTRKLPFGKELYIEQDDFRETPPPKYFRLSPGKEVRLRYAYFVTCQRVVKDPQTGNMRTKVFTVEARAAFIEATTASSVNHENATRCFELMMDETEAQTRRIHDRQRGEQQHDDHCRDHHDHDHFVTHGEPPDVASRPALPLGTRKQSRGPRSGSPVGAVLRACALGPGIDGAAVAFYRRRRERSAHIRRTPGSAMSG